VIVDWLSWFVFRRACSVQVYCIWVSSLQAWWRRQKGTLWLYDKLLVYFHFSASDFYVFRIKTM